MNKGPSQYLARKGRLRIVRDPLTVEFTPPSGQVFSETSPEKYVETPPPLVPDADNTGRKTNAPGFYAGPPPPLGGPPR